MFVCHRVLAVRKKWDVMGEEIDEKKRREAIKVNVLYECVSGW